VRRFRVESSEPLVTLHRRLQISSTLEGACQVQHGFREVGLSGDGHEQDADGFAPSPEATIDVAEVGQIKHVVRIDARGAFEQLGGLLEFAGIDGEHAEQEHGVAMVRRLLEHATIEVLGASDLSRAVALHRNFEDRGVSHRKSPVGGASDCQTHGSKRKPCAVRRRFLPRRRKSKAVSLLSIRMAAARHLGAVAAPLPSLVCVSIEPPAGKPPLEALQIVASPPAVARMPAADSRLRSAVGNHLGLVWRVLRRTGLGPADAEDASQDVFWVLAQRFDDVPERAQRSFLVSTALRVAADRKQSKWHRSVSAGLDVEARMSEAPLPDEAVDIRRAGALLDEALATLDPLERSVFVLAELEQMTRAEVAEVLGLPEGTVASRLKRAREALEVAVRRLRARRRASR